MQLSIYEPQFNWHVGAIFFVKIALTLLSSFEDLRLSKCDYELIESGWQTYWLQTYLRNVRIWVLSAAGLTKQQAWAKSSYGRHSYKQFFYSIDLSEGIGLLYKVWGDAIGHKFLRELLWNYRLAEYKLKYIFPAEIMEMHVIISWCCGGIQFDTKLRTEAANEAGRLLLLPQLQRELPPFPALTPQLLPQICTSSTPVGTSCIHSQHSNIVNHCTVGALCV